jgi:two-component system, chemotaxis family, protein-glutamate methylesterase/glutaminase
MSEISTETFRNIIVIGASAGGFNAIEALLAQMPSARDAAVCVVLHLSSKSNAETIVHSFQKHTSIVCSVAEDGSAIEKGHLYLAPANLHMMIKNNSITVNMGARDNKYRPSIDVLFRSAAVHYGARVIGIILTGMLDDGTSGMNAIKRCGGITIVQEPLDAEFVQMPQSVINQVKVDYRVKLQDVGSVIADILAKPLPKSIPVPRELAVEAEITENMMTSINELREIGNQSEFTCPDCGGGLWIIKNEGGHRYRCHTGHVYTENILYDEQGANLEESVWVSLRMLEERRNMLGLMATHAEQSGNLMLATENRKRSADMEKHIKALKVILSNFTVDIRPEQVKNKGYK